MDGSDLSRVPSNNSQNNIDMVRTDEHGNDIQSVSSEDEISKEIHEKALKEAKEAAVKILSRVSPPYPKEIQEEAKRKAEIVYKQVLARYQEAKRFIKQTDIMEGLKQNHNTNKKIYEKTSEHRSPGVSKVNEALDTSDIDNNKLNIVKKVPVKFIWSQGGKDVYFAYSGDSWSQKYRMHKGTNTNDFSIIMNLSPGVHHYKFIVDNEWKCAKDQERVEVKDNAFSNYIDVKLPNDNNNNINVNNNNNNNNNMSNNNNNNNGTIDFVDTNNNGYSTFIPPENTYASDPPIIPPHLGDVLLNSKPKTNEHPLILPQPMRVSINHLVVADKHDEQVVALGITERFKDKFVTTVYYKPIETKGDKIRVDSLQQNVQQDYY